MKKILILVLLVGLLGFFISDYKKPQNLNESVSISPTPSDNLSNNYFQVTYNGQLINAAIIKIENSRSLTLIPNFEEKLSSAEIMKRNNCKAGFSGGFYDKEDKPIGLFKSNNSYLGDMLVDDPFFNGYFVGIDDGGLGVVSGLSERGYLFIVQSGPLLFDEWKPRKLKLLNDEQARRIVVAKYTADTYVIAFYDPNSYFSGPYLSDVGELIVKLEEKMGTKIPQALNLDGGGASAFYNEKTRLEELISVGSFFCIK